LLYTIQSKYCQEDTVAFEKRVETGDISTRYLHRLCRLYDSTEGEILFNGVDIREFECEEYLKLFSIVFMAGILNCGALRLSIT